VLGAGVEAVRAEGDGSVGQSGKEPGERAEEEKVAIDVDRPVAGSRLVFLDPIDERGLLGGEKLPRGAAGADRCKPRIEVPDFFRRQQINRLAKAGSNHAGDVFVKGADRDGGLRMPLPQGFEQGDALAGVMGIEVGDEACVQGRGASA